MANIDYENLRRVLMLGVADACKDAGLTRFVLSINIEPAFVAAPEPETMPEVKIEVIELTEEQANELARGLPS